ncbi:MAG TPA: hypothetical protein ENJ35_06405 [Gammaproteobacteria bacterium]|nr:hypothetical protein [Gammaproteobacteria bacterium]
MAKKLIVLRNMPDDEIEDIHALLKENGIDYYETPAGNWGISMPALWVENTAEFDQARSLLDEYENDRQQRVKAEYEQLVREGKARTIWDEIREKPFRFLLYTGFIGFILYFSIHPFLNFLSTDP